MIQLTFKKTPKETYGVSSVAFSPDGKTLAVGNRDRTVTLWDVATGRRQAPLLGADHSKDVNAVAVISPDGNTLASGSNRLHDQVVGPTDAAGASHPGWPQQSRYEFHNSPQTARRWRRAASRRR